MVGVGVQVRSGTGESLQGDDVQAGHAGEVGTHRVNGELRESH